MENCVEELRKAREEDWEAITIGGDRKQELEKESRISRNSRASGHK